MSRESNPRELSDEAIRVLVEHGMCPMCLGKLDTLLGCKECNYDVSPIAERLFSLDEDFDHIEVTNEGMADSA